MTSLLTSKEKFRTSIYRGSDLYRGSWYTMVYLQEPQIGTWIWIWFSSLGILKTLAIITPFTAKVCVCVESLEKEIVWEAQPSQFTKCLICQFECVWTERGGRHWENGKRRCQCAQPSPSFTIGLVIEWGEEMTFKGLAKRTNGGFCVVVVEQMWDKESSKRSYETDGEGKTGPSYSRPSCLF